MNSEQPGAVMRQLCPSCAMMVELPENAAGTEAPCPSCGKLFSVPKAYAPSVGEKPPPPPGLVPPAPPTPMPEGSSAPQPTMHECGITIAGGPVGWVPVLALTVALVTALFFSWVGAFPGGVRAFTQSPIQALFATYQGNTVPILQDAEKGIEANIRSNWLMLPGLLVLLAATVFSWLERLFPNPTLNTVPAPLGWLVNVWPRRFLILTGFTTLALALLVLQSLRGFGLETAIQSMATQQFSKQQESADTPHLKQEVRIRIGQEYGKYCVTDTNASYIGLIALAFALAGLLLNWWLARRGTKAPPRLVLHS